MLKGEKSFSIALPAVLSNGTANELPVLTDQQNECEELRARVKQRQGFCGGAQDGFLSIYKLLHRFIGTGTGLTLIMTDIDTAEAPTSCSALLEA
jgi:hypothetical protein